MPSPETLGVFVAACLVLILTPGPCLALVTARSAAQGTGAGLMAVLGNGMGTLVLGVLVAGGIGSILAESPEMLATLRWAGGAYLGWLAWCALAKAFHATPVPDVDRASMPRIFRESFIVNLLNPKGVLFYLAFLPQFVSLDGAPVALQLLGLSALHMTLMMSIEALLALSVGRARAWLGASRRVRRLQQGALGTTFALLALFVAFGK